MILTVANYVFEFLLSIFIFRFYVTYPLASYMVVKKKEYSLAEYTSKVRKCGSSMINTSFYIILSYKIYQIIKNEHMFPTFLGGSGTLEEAVFRDLVSKNLENYRDKVSIDIMSFYHFQLAFHIAETIMHVVSPKRSDFIEMLIHHAATLSLVFYSMIYNRTNVGILIMFLHDISDIPVYITKTFSDTNFTKTTIASFLLLVSGWIYFRIYALGVIIYELLSNSEGFHFNMTCVLVILYMLHYYWLALMFRMAYNLIFNKKIEDTQERHLE